MTKKRVYEVVNNNPYNDSLILGKEKLKFGSNNLMYVHDEDKGKEIKRLYDGADAVVNETEIYVGSEPGHRYTFGAMSVKEPGGNEPVRVKTADGYTVVSRAVAEEDGLQIVSGARVRRRKRPKVKHAKA